MARKYSYSNLELARKSGLRAASSQKPSRLEQEIMNFFEANGLRNYKIDPEFFPLTFEVHASVPVLSKFYNVDFVIPSRISPLIVIEVKEIKSRLYETHSPKAHMLNSRFANFKLQYPKIKCFALIEAKKVPNVYFEEIKYGKVITISELKEMLSIIKNAAVVQPNESSGVV